MFLSCHVAFQSESSLYSCLNVKDVLDQNRRKIWRLNDCNWTRTQNHLVSKRTLNHLAKVAKCWAAFSVLISHQHLSLFHHWSELHFLPSNLHLQSHGISFVNIFDWFIPAMMLNMLRFKSSVLFGTHTLLDKSFRVLQLPTHRSNLQMDSSEIRGCIH